MTTESKKSVDYSAKNPRFVWTIGAYREQFPDMPDVSETCLFDRQEGKPVLTVHSDYGQLFCLETVPDGAPFTALELWANRLSNGALASEGIAETANPRRIERTQRIPAALAFSVMGCEPDEKLLCVVRCWDQWEEPIGYYEVLKDGRFACTVANDGIVDASEEAVRAWLLANSIN